MNQANECNLYDIAKEHLSKEYPGGRVDRPTTLLWWIFDRKLKYALSARNEKGGAFAYVVLDKSITVRHMEDALQYPFEWGWDGNHKLIIYIHKDAVIDEGLSNYPYIGDVEFRRIGGCNCMSGT